MKILIASHSFSPAVGGIEQVSETLAEQFSALGHEVRVVTHTPGADQPGRPYAVYRSPGRAGLFELIRWADVYLQSNIALQLLWPALLLRKPTLVVYHTWIQRPDGRSAWQDRLKGWIARRVTRNLAVSTALAESVPTQCGTIPNPYDDALFVYDPTVARSGDLLFLGRLVSDKGADLLLDALALLGARGIRPQLSIVGSGPEEAALKDQVDRLKLQAQVRFLGVQRHHALVEQLNAHRILVVPSRWAEPFGLVALEGMACGMQVVAAHIGGLPEAVGPCGSTFAPGNAQALANSLEAALAQPQPLQLPSPTVIQHLERHRARAVAQAYLAHLSQIAPSTAPQPGMAT